MAVLIHCHRGKLPVVRALQADLEDRAARLALRVEEPAKEIALLAGAREPKPDRDEVALSWISATSRGELANAFDGRHIRVANAGAQNLDKSDQAWPRRLTPDRLAPVRSAAKAIAGGSHA